MQHCHPHVCCRQFLEETGPAPGRCPSSPGHNGQVGFSWAVGMLLWHGGRSAEWAFQQPGSTRPVRSIGGSLGRHPMRILSAMPTLSGQMVRGWWWKFHFCHSFATCYVVFDHPLLTPLWRCARPTNGPGSIIAHYQCDRAPSGLCATIPADISG